MIFMVVSAVVIVFILAMLGRISNFFGKSNHLRSNNQLHLKSNYSTASDKADNGHRSHTFYRNCEVATTEPITGDITGNHFHKICL